MGPRLVRLLPLLVLALAGCGDRVPASEGLEAKLKEANLHSNDGTSVQRDHSMKPTSS